MLAFAVSGLRTVVLNGVKLAHVQRGAGAPSVVFGHGGYSDLRTWLQQLDALPTSTESSCTAAVTLVAMRRSPRATTTRRGHTLTISSA
ncbi:hypothetical protein HRbin30_00301 [bacterium HR30]|nr:hypothetical protein HRbin30_00301 [bacterium HR30]